MMTKIKIPEGNIRINGKQVSVVILLELYDVQKFFDTEIFIRDGELQFLQNSDLQDVLELRVAQIIAYIEILSKYDDQISELDKFDQFIAYYEKNEGNKELMQDELVKNLKDQLK
ncbi:hypothetical protein SS50377_21796 [Spironucleus salmonicida]|uniref:Uncharacterized protein n=1 Tax=Spironucleus salmonicida TaxID=348837 RepID=A0A9P8LXP7_9EUKA|nr:hypothetical protein SS50377_21796 [Spironucleus salmonicida]